jgi:hypothetical protein
MIRLYKESNSPKAISKSLKSGFFLMFSSDNISYSQAQKNLIYVKPKFKNAL